MVVSCPEREIDSVVSSIATTLFCPNNSSSFSSIRVSSGMLFIITAPLREVCNLATSSCPWRLFNSTERYGQANSHAGHIADLGVTQSPARRLQATVRSMARGKICVALWQKIRWPSTFACEAWTLSAQALCRLKSCFSDLPSTYNRDRSVQR
jgi:hypothetical protein